MNKIDSIYNRIKERNRLKIKIIKKNIIKSRFLTYFLKERKKLIAWNRNYRLFVFSFFALKLRLSADFKKRWEDLFVTTFILFAKYFDDLVKSGWRQELLSVKEYNLIVFLIDFYNKMSNIVKSKSISPKEFFLMEEAFLKIAHKEENKKLIICGLDKYLTFYAKLFNKEKIPREEINKRLNYFFSFNFYKPSFYDFILAYNMVYYKRYLEWNDVICSHTGNVMQYDFYDCPKEVFYEIAEYIKGLVKDIKKLEKEKQQLEWLRDYINNNLHHDPELLIKFYEKLGHFWNKDRDDVLLLLLLLIKGIIQTLDEFLHNGWEIMTDKEKIIRFSLASIPNLSAHYERIVHEYELANEYYVTMLPAKVSLTEFLSKDYPSLLFASKSQRAIFEKIEIILGHIHELAIIFKDLQDVKENQEKNSFASYAKYMIVRPEEWRGQPVFSICNYYMELFLQICRFFKEKNLQAKMHRLHLLAEQIKEQNKLKRALDITGYLEKHISEAGELQ